jgi:hypothetical protein
MSDIIYLSEIFTALHPLNEYKMHFAKPDSTEPLDAYMRDFKEWEAWNRWSNGKDDFNRKYIFSLISFYPEHDTWLFGGIWEVLQRDFVNGGEYPYTISLCEDYSKFIGRLKIKYAHKDRQVRNVMEHYFPKLVVKEILEEPYSIHTFPGYKNLDVPFMTLENVINKDHPSWKNALSIKGIYLITDTKTGKKYVGKASGEKGFWQRWGDYICDGHGGDVDLRKLIDSNGGIQYARENYKFTLLEIVESNIENDIDDRESYWKRVLMSRLESVGHNKN